MRILLHKISNDRHALELVHGDGHRERMTCETRSYLQHDLLHYAVESEATLDGGFWGSLAGGRALAEMNDHTGSAPADDGAELMVIEQVVGALSGALRDPSPDAVVAALRRYAASLGSAPPRWLESGLVAAVQERMRQLVGRWRATAFGSVMELEWPAPRARHRAAPSDSRATRGAGRRTP